MQRKSKWIVASLTAVLLIGGLVWRSSARQDAKEFASPSPDKNQPAKLSAHARGPLATAKDGNTSLAVKPLPAPGTPLKKILVDLESRDRAGDAEAASRLYDDLATCARVQIANRTTPAIAAQTLSETGAPNSPAAAQNANSRLDRIQQRLDFAHDNATLCAGIDASDVARIVPDTLQAARLGNTQAADCYVFADLNTWFNLGMADNPQWLDDYKENSLDVAIGAVQHGDWNMVNLLNWAYRGGMTTHGLLPQVTGLNPTQAYTYEKLWALGHPPNAAQATSAAQYLANYAAQMKLSPTQMQAAEVQAQDMYQKYFNNTPVQGPPRDTLRACEMNMP